MKSISRSNPSSSSESTSTVIDILSPRPSASSWPEDIEDEDATTVYSYFSTWSSNYTSSNLVGPGRLLGNLYSRAESFLEQQLRKLVNGEELRANAMAVSLLLTPGVAPGTLYDMMWSGNAEKMEMACDALLRCAR